MSHISRTVSVVGMISLGRSAATEFETTRDANSSLNTRTDSVEAKTVGGPHEVSWHAPVQQARPASSRHRRLPVIVVSD